MRQIWIPPEMVVGDAFDITGESHHHMVAVMRASVGEEFEGISGLDEALVLRIVEVTKKKLHVAVVARRKLDALPRPLIGLAFCVPKFPIFEDVLEKAVEMGASAVQPLISERSFIRSTKDVSSSRDERWLKIVQSACAQSQRAKLMQVLPPVGLTDFVVQTNQKPDVACLMAYEGSSSPLRPTLQELKIKQKEWVWIIVGPEGGFSDGEAQNMQVAGMPMVSLGPLVLRTETACFTLLSVLKYELGILP